MIGQTLGNYQVEARLGEGAMGVVYRVRHVHLEEQMAVKVMKKELAANPNFQQRFREEAKRSFSLYHPHIVTVKEYGEQEGVFYFVMELMPDGSLRVLLQRRTEQSYERSLRHKVELVQQATQGLAYAHDRGLVHRDIKPSNLLLKREGETYQLKVADFGLVTIAGEADGTATGMPVGTYTHMSPEQCQGHPLNGRSDVYSLGVVLYEATTGFLPFPARSFNEAYSKHVYVPAPPPRSVRPDVPEELEDIILRCLEKSPSKRFRAVALGEALGAWLQKTEPHTEPISIAPPPVEPLPGPSSVPRVRVLDLVGNTQQVAELHKALTVGRTPENDVALGAQMVSRQHLRIEWDGRQVRVTDLGSTNGTLLAGRPLAPHVPAVWPEEEMVQAGACWLRLEPVIEEEEDGEHIGIALAPTELELTPGQPQELRVTLENLGRRVDHFTLSIEGVPPEWVTVPPAWAKPPPGADPPEGIRLLPKEQRQVSLEVSVPREPSSLAGTYAVTVWAWSGWESKASGKAPGAAGIAEGLCAGAEGHWRVLPFEAGTLRVTPAKASGRIRGAYTLTLRNQGNARAEYDVKAEDDEQVLRFDYEKAHLAMEPTTNQAEETVRILVRTRPRWIGHAQPRNIHFTVSSLGTGSWQERSTVQFVHVPVIPIWAFPLLGALLLLGYYLWGYLHTPVIEDWEVSPREVMQGDTVTISWRVRRAGEVRIENAGSTPIYAGAAQDTTLVHVPHETTHYKLVVSNGDRVPKHEPVPEEVIVRVPLPPLPEIVSFEATRRTVEPGGEVVLTWHVEHADQIRLEPIGRTDLRAQDAVTVWPRESTEYRLVASSTRRDTSVVSLGLRVTVLDEPSPPPPPPPPNGPTQTNLPTITRFQVEPDTVYGTETQTIQFDWHVTGATSIRIAGIEGDLDATGSHPAPAPSSTTTYTLIATNGDGEREDSVHVVVMGHLTIFPRQSSSITVDGETLKTGVNYRYPVYPPTGLRRVTVKREGAPEMWRCDVPVSQDELRIEIDFEQRVDQYIGAAKPAQCGFGQ